MDEDRNALYTRSENGVVAVYDLGVNNADAPRRVAEVRDIAGAAQMARGGGLFYDQGRSGGMGGGFGNSGFGGNNYGGHNMTQNKTNQLATQKGKKLVHVAVVSAAESSTITLVAVCADGRRVYLTSLPSAGYGGRYNGGGIQYNGVTGNSQNSQRCLTPAVTRLAIIAVRDPPPQSSATRGMTSAQALRAMTTVRPLEVEAAFYAEGVMLLSDAAEVDEDARLFVASRDASLPSHLRTVSNADIVQPNSPYGATQNNIANNQQPFSRHGAEGAGYAGGVSGGGGSANAHAARSLREAVTTRWLTGRAASSVGSMGEVPPPPAALRDLDPPFPQGLHWLGGRSTGTSINKSPSQRIIRGGEIATQHVAPRRKFVLVTNAGVVLLEKARPVDALRELLLDDVHEHIGRFFAAYGQAEAATMCLAVALGACADAPGLGDAERQSTGARVGGTDIGDFFTGRATTPASMAAASERARLALEDPRLTGEPRVDEDLDTAPLGQNAGVKNRFDQFDMGRAIVQPRSHFSGVHAACYTYAARLLAAAWERPVAVTLSVSSVGNSNMGNGRTGHGAHHGLQANSPLHGGARGAANDRRPLREAVANGAAANSAVGVASAAAGWLGGILRLSRAVGAPVLCTLPVDALASLEKRLRPLERFLATRRPRVFSLDDGRVGSSPNGRLNDPRDPKRRRVDQSAARAAEERSLAALRGTLRRAAEAAALLRIAGEVGFSRVAANLSPEDRDALTRDDCTLRRVATTAEGAHLASSLVEALMSALVADGDVAAAESAASRLQQSCPLFFGGEERRFYRARESLQAARDARDVLVAETKTAEALVSLLEVPAAGNLSATMAELADAGCFHGLVALPLSAAAAQRRRRGFSGTSDGNETTEAFFADGASFSSFNPEQNNVNGSRGVNGTNGVNTFDDTDRSTAASMTASTPEACREYVCVALRALVTGSPDEGAPPGSLGAVCASLPPATRAKGVAAILDRAAQASSPAAAAAARARLVAAKADGEAAAAAAARAGAPFIPPPALRHAEFSTSTASITEAEGASLDDDAFIKRIYSELIVLGKDVELLTLPPGPLEQYLAEKGAFATAQQGGALTQHQAQHLELLAKLYAVKGRNGLAARVYFALAERNAQGAAVPLTERASLLDLAYKKASGEGNSGDAIRNCQSVTPATTSQNEHGTSHVTDSAFLETLDGKLKVLGFQQRLRSAFLERARVAGMSNQPAVANAATQAASDLERELRPLSDMFNDFARPAEMWDLCLEMLHFSRYRDSEGDRGVARGLWDHLLASAARDGLNNSSLIRALRDACASVKALGFKLFPSDAAFPVAHVALKLELLAAGLWKPDGADVHVAAVDAEDDVAECVLASTRDSFEAAHAAYARLLATPAHRAHHDRTVQREQHLQTPALRLRLLRSALRVLRRWEASLTANTPADGNGFVESQAGGFGSYGGGNERARFALADVCAGYAGEARRLLQVPMSAQGTAEALAADFEALGRRLAA